METSQIKLVDEGFSLKKRLQLAMHFTPIGIQKFPERPAPNITAASYEIDKLDNYFNVVIPAEKHVLILRIQEDLVMIAAKLAQFNQKTSNFLFQEAGALGIVDRLPSKANAAEYWETGEPVKKVLAQSFVRPGHHLADNQTLFIEIRQSGVLQNSDYIFRSSRGEVLFKLLNVSSQQMQRRLQQKLKTFPHQNTLCAFISGHAYRTIDLEYFRELTSREVEFLYIHKNYQPKPECLQLASENQLHHIHNFTLNPKIYVFKHNEHTVVGTKAAVALAREGKIDELLAQFERMLQQEKNIIQKILPQDGQELRLTKLRYLLVNILKRQSACHLQSNLELAICDIIKYCMSETKKYLINNQNNHQKRNLGHFAVKLRHCKECRVCLKQYNEWSNSKKKPNKTSGQRPKKKKSKYQCEACSAREARPVALCVTCFKQYHFHMDMYADSGRGSGNNGATSDYDYYTQQKVLRNSQSSWITEVSTPVVPGVAVKVEAAEVSAHMPVKVQAIMPLPFNQIKTQVNSMLDIIEKFKSCSEHLENMASIIDSCENDWNGNLTQQQLQTMWQKNYN